jgi:hypothetical protein
VGIDCAVQDCVSGATRRGMCDKHYRRWKTYGDPEVTFTSAQRSALARERNKRLAADPARRDAVYAKVAAANKAKRNVRTCVVCGATFGGPEHSYAKPCQKTCSRRCGQTHRRIETDARHAKGMLGTDYAQRHCEQCTNPIPVKRDSSYRKRRFCSLSCRAQHQAGQPYAEWRAKIGQANAGKLTGHRNPMWNTTPPHGKWTSYAAADGKTYRFRSTWEVAVAAYLDAVEEPWCYETERFVFDDITYLPDFYLPLRGVYWEVKGWLSDKARRRIDAFRANRAEPLVVVGAGMLKGLKAHTRRKPK